MSFLDKTRLKETVINKGSSKKYFIKKFTAVFAKLDFNNGVSFSLFYLQPCTFLPSYAGLILSWDDSELSESCASGVHCVKKCSNTEFFSGLYFSAFSPNTEKYGPVKTRYLDTFLEVVELLLVLTIITAFTVY